MRSKLSCWIAAIVISGSALFLLIHRSDHFGDSTLSLDLSELFAWRPMPASIGDFGHVVNGKFEEPEELFVWRAREEADLQGIDPRVLLWGQIVLATCEFPEGAPPSLNARVQAFRSNGSPLTEGLVVRFVRISSDSDHHTYRSEKPMIFMWNPMLEGERNDLIALYSDGDCWTRILAE